MKTNYFLKKAFGLFASVAFVLQASAADPVIVSGVAYNLNEADPTMAEVVALPGGAKYTGTISIQANVQIAGTTYPVKKIGDGSLRDAPSLTGVIIPDGLEVIGNSSFASCTGITGIVLPASVKSIEDWAFYGCSALASINIPDGITTITEHTFQQSGLTSIVLPASVTSLKVCAFQDASKLASINLENVREIVAWSLYGTAIKSVTVNSVPFVGACAFAKCPELESATFNGVISTGEWTFQDCPKLTSATLNNLESLDGGAFSGCSSLASLTIPNTVAFIGNWALEKTALKEIFVSWEAPDNEVYIEDSDDASAFGVGEGRIDFTWKVPLEVEDAYGGFWMGYPVEVGVSSIENAQAENVNAYYANGTFNLINLSGYDASIISLDGRVVSRLQVVDANYSVPMSLTSGIYLLNATNGANKVAVKFIVK